MAFESLTEKLSNIFSSLRGRGKLSEKDVDAALKEVRMALLEADVNFRVVKNFVASVRERAVGTEVLSGLNPAQTVIRIVDEEMTQLMGPDTVEFTFQPGKQLTVVMMCGLQGSGKTTTSGKLAGLWKTKGKKTLLAALDIYRPAAIKQLQVVGEQQKTEVFTPQEGQRPPEIAKNAVAYAAANGFHAVILDTAGRLQIDDDMMAELEEIKKNVEVHQTLLVVDAMTGQEAVNVAKTFNERIGVDGIILSKLDGDTRGGAALSVRAVTGRPILYAGMGEKLSDLEQFYPDRMASRILGMGDVLTLIDKAQAAAKEQDEKASKEMASRVRKGKFDYNDYLESMKQMRNMGGLSSILGMLPGMGLNKAELEGAIDEKQLAKIEAIVLSMTPEERANPKLMTPQRKFRIAKGSGNDIAEVNRFIKQFEQMQKMMKQMPGLFGGKRRRGGNPFGGFGGRRGKFPFG
ncbi:MAG: signal recognition particle protein [Lachnospiraceae bacterium]|nr:signal recognition particle protein [Lachnospiraceae bacterium]